MGNSNNSSVGGGFNPFGNSNSNRQRNQGNRAQRSNSGNNENNNNRRRASGALRDNSGNMYFVIDDPSAGNNAGSPQDITQRIAAARASGRIPRDARAIPIRIPLRSSDGSATAFGNGSAVRRLGTLGEALLQHIEDAQLEYALALSRQDFEHQPVGPPPTEQEILDKRLVEKILELGDVEDNVNAHCSICCESQHAGDLAIKLPCGHAFHKHCVVPWLKKHDTCPVCRLELNEYFKKQDREQELLAAKQDEMRRRHEEEILIKKKKMDELHRSESPSLFDFDLSIPIDQWSIKQMKEALKRLGLEEESKSALEKETLVEMLQNASNNDFLMKQPVEVLQRRLRHMKVPFNEDNPNIAILARRLSDVVASVLPKKDVHGNGNVMTEDKKPESIEDPKTETHIPDPNIAMRNFETNPDIKCKEDESQPLNTVSDSTLNEESTSNK